MPTAKQDVLSYIKSQHEEVKRLLSAVAAQSGDAREDAFCDLRRMLAVHETAEQEVVYPVLRTSGPDGSRVAEARAHEEAAATKVLAELEKMGTQDAQFETKFDGFRADVLKHAEAEEAEVFPIVQKVDETTQSRMFKAFELAEKVAPTHPHPAAGASTAAHLVTGPALAIVDRVRDAIKSG